MQGDDGRTFPLGNKPGLELMLAKPGQGNDPQPVTQLWLKILGGRLTCRINAAAGGAQLRHRIELWISVCTI